MNAASVPRALKWLPNISMIKYCFEALCVNEFRGLDFETQRRPGDVATGEQVLSVMNLPSFVSRLSFRLDVWAVAYDDPSYLFRPAH